MIEVVKPGIATTVQDAGRPGHAHLGVGTSGFADPALAGLVNRLVGNLPDAAAFESCGGLEIEAVDSVICATSHLLSPVELRAGERISLPSGSSGRLWHYLAVRGGVDVVPVLNSRSFDTLAGLGPQPPRVGTRYAVGRPAREFVPVDVAPLAELPQTARVSVGPRSDWFVEHSYERFCAATWTVTATSRVGVRLSGPVIERRRREELPSEGLTRGAIQLPPNGEPIMMLADYPTTGGYPVIAVVHPDDVSVVAQHAAGRSVGFRHAL